MIEIFPISEVDDAKGRHTRALMNIIFNFNVKVMAEIGVYKGELMRDLLRSKGVAGQLRQYFAIDPWDVNEVHWRRAARTDWDRMYWNVCKYMPWFPALRIVRLKSVEAALFFPEGFFDLVYIDGDHSYSSVKADIAAWLPTVKRGGLIGGHDYVDDDSRITEIYDVRRAVRGAFGEDFQTYKSWTWYKVIK